MKIKHYKITVAGTVREMALALRALKTANELDIFGKATYKSGNRLEILAEGKEESLNQFICWCQQLREEPGIFNIEVSKGTVKPFNEFEMNL